MKDDNIRAENIDKPPELIEIGEYKALVVDAILKTVKNCHLITQIDLSSRQLTQHRVNAISRCCDVADMNDIHWVESVSKGKRICREEETGIRKSVEQSSEGCQFWGPVFLPWLLPSNT